MALAFAPRGKGLIITKITADEKTKRHLGNLGLTVGGSVVSLYDNGGDVIVRIKDGKLALNKALALKIMVA